jgi:hypothetical protein
VLVVLSSGKMQKENSLFCLVLGLSLYPNKSLNTQTNCVFTGYLKVGVIFTHTNTLKIPPPTMKRQAPSSSSSSSSRTSSKGTKGTASSKRRRAAGAPQNNLLDMLPRRESTLDQHTLVHDLEPPLLLQIREYLLKSFPGSPEVATALLDYVAVHHPTHLRVKELFETVEVVKHAGAHIHQLKPCVIYDLACGHGLGGVLLAYRFPLIQVFCCDRQQRPCFQSYLEAFAKYGDVTFKNKRNVHFLEGEVEGDSVAGQTVAVNSYHLCIHGCNEMTTIALNLADKTNSGYTVVPCCIRHDVFGVRTKSAYNRWKMPDETRYAVQVGFLGGKVRCDRIANIDRRITNRNLLLIGKFEG